MALAILWRSSESILLRRPLSIKACTIPGLYMRARILSHPHSAAADSASGSELAMTFRSRVSLLHVQPWGKWMRGLLH